MKKFLGIWALALVVGFIGMFLAYGDDDGESLSSLQAKAVVSVRQQLRDPASAQFDTPIVIESKHLVCGFVNAKNGFGGYTGKQLYVYSGGSAIIFPGPPSELAAKNFKDQLSICGLLARS